MEGQWTSPVVEKAIENGARRLARRDVPAALRALADGFSERRSSSYVLRGLAEGAAEFPGFAGLAADLGRLPAMALARLMGASSGFTRRVVEGVNGDGQQWKKVFSRAFAAAGDVAKGAIRRSAVDMVAGGVVEWAIPRLLEGVAREELPELACLAMGGSARRSAALHRALWDVACVEGAEDLLREAVMDGVGGRRGRRVCVADVGSQET